MQQVNYRGHQHHASANAQKSHQYSNDEPQHQNYECHVAPAGEPPNRSNSAVCIALIFTPHLRKRNAVPAYSAISECEILETSTGSSSSQAPETVIVSMSFISLALEPVSRATSEEEHFPSHGNGQKT
jgi:hypothetical protein